MVFAPRLSFCTSPVTLVTVPFFSYAESSGEHNIGAPRSLGQKHILNNDEGVRRSHLMPAKRICAYDPEDIQVSGGQHGDSSLDQAQGRCRRLDDSREADQAAAPCRMRHANSSNRPGKRT